MEFTDFKPVFLVTDMLVYLLFLGMVAFVYSARRRQHYRIAWHQLKSRRLAMICLGLILLYAGAGLLDSVHFQWREHTEEGAPRKDDEGRPVYQTEILSLLDLAGAGLRARTEKTFSAPFAARQFTKELVTREDGTLGRDFPRLRHGGRHLEDLAAKPKDIAGLVLRGVLTGAGIGVVLVVLTVGLFVGVNRLRPPGERQSAARAGLGAGIFLGVVALVIATVAVLSTRYHVLGTDQVGQDVLFRALKGCRVGLIVGTLTTLIATPIAILCGIMAGYLGGRVDDAIQYIYTTLSSIPSILLIAAAMLIVTTNVERANTAWAGDTRLLWLCVVLGVGSWTGLCRLIRGETLKLRENEYVQAAEALGVNRLKIMVRHLLPNVAHIVLISVVLRFSGLVLAEAVLAYVGIGVDPSMESWGNMINAARLDISRDPVVWWNLLAAFVFMFGLVLPANIFGDAVRDALDPRLKTE